MASNPSPFQVEDNTDQDFFDKLVNDDHHDVDFKVTTTLSASVAPVLSDGNERVEAKAFAKLGVNELDNNGDVNNDNSVDLIREIQKADDKLEAAEESENPTVALNSIAFENLMHQPENEDVSAEALSDSKSSGDRSSNATVISKSSGELGSPGVKEVGWGAFNADSVENDGIGFGSYSDFFSELGGNGLTNGSHVLIGNQAHGSANVENSNNFGQYNQGYDYGIAADQSTHVQHLNSSPYWENQYPGWKYDSSTGQWYQVDGYEQDVSYFQQTAQSSAETGRTGSVANWNQVSLDNNGYPPHMVFDPQYPGWYYDTIAQEWRTLESYTVSTAQGQDQMNQSGYESSNTYQSNDQKTYSTFDQGNNYYNPQGSSMWKPENVSSFVSTHGDRQNTVSYGATGSYYENASQVENDFSMSLRSQGFGGGNMTQFDGSRINQNDQKHVNDCYNNQNAINFSQQHIGNAQISYAPSAGRSSAGRPAHALVTFGFGGKLIVLKDNNPAEFFNLGSQNLVGGSISVLDLAEVVNRDAIGVCNYFQALCRQCIPGPLSGGSIGTRELNKWIDERIASPEDADRGSRKAEMKLLLSLLKIACQYYGKLRSPYGTEAVSKESDVPESAVARLFASAKGNGSQFSQYDAAVQCFHQMPSKEQMQVTATEVQSLLVSGRKKEALQCAQEGQLWGPALILAAQLGDQFYVETVKHMALHQFIAGSPLRTLCLLIAGQPADVFSTNATAINGMVGAVNMPQQPGEFASNGMLDDWEENLAVITANRTKDDELVLMHLGDCLWKGRSDIIAAHICYLVAEASFEPYSDTARMCLVGADHWKFPRTYTSPEAIQRTEIYEYSKTLGNSQFVLLPFQPYKLIYAQMLAEVGRISDASKYCQTVLKSLKSGRTPEVEALRHLASSLEERIKAHQQGGFSTNLAPKKLVGKLLNLFDSTAHRVVGSIPPPVPSEKRVSSSQSTMAMSSLVPSPTADSNRKAMHTRSVSEPDFGRSPMQAHADSSKEASSAGVQEKASERSRFRRFSFGSQLFQMTVGLVLKPRQGRQAKLGETNKFYYDEKLKRWVEEGSEPPAEEAALPPPPTTSAFQNGTSDYNLNSARRTEASHSSGSPEFKNPSVDNNSGMPPLPPASNQYSTRGRMGVRSRYVDTFNKGGGNTANLFQSTPAPSIKPAVSGGNPKKFFIPHNPVETSAKTIQDTLSYENPSTSPLSDSSSMTMQRFGSMDNISSDNGSFPVRSRRTASWGGAYSDSSLVSSSTNGANFRDHPRHEVAL